MTGSSRTEIKIITIRVDSIAEALRQGFVLDPAHILAFGINREGKIHIIVTDMHVKFVKKVMLPLEFLDGYYYLASVQSYDNKKLALIEMESELRLIFEKLFRADECFRNLILSSAKLKSNCPINDIYFVSRNLRKVVLTYSGEGLENLYVLNVHNINIYDPRITMAGGILARRNNSLYYLSPENAAQKKFLERDAWKEVYDFLTRLRFLGRINNGRMTVHFCTASVAIEIEVLEDNGKIDIKTGRHMIAHGHLIINGAGNAVLARPDGRHALVTIGDEEQLTHYWDYLHV